jgi:hypothetical protein
MRFDGVNRAAFSVFITAYVVVGFGLMGLPRADRGGAP